MRETTDNVASLLVGGFTFLVAVLCSAVLVLRWVDPVDEGFDWADFRANRIIPFAYEAWDLIKKNQFCQALGFSSVSYYAVYVLGFLYRTFILPIFSSMSSSIVLHNTDPNFNTIIDYLSEHILAESPGKFSSVQATTKKKDLTRKDWIQEWLGTSSRDVPKFEYRPDTDDIIHSFKYKGQKIYLTRSKSGDALMGSDSEKPFTPESLTLTVWGSSDGILRELLTEALVAVSEQKREDTLNIYIQSSSSWLVGWELALTKKARPKDSVILDVDDMDVLLNDARRFLDSSAWYLDKGIPYRRGYMLYGPPGCGKTSFAQVLAGELKLDICMLALTHAGLTDNDLCELLRDAPRNSVIVLEDVDAVFVERNATGAGGGRGRKSGDSAVSFSGLLNAIDGVASQEGKIFFMTTNHIEKLDAALLRPGRCDVKFEVKNASKQQMERMFLRFYPGEQALAAQFSSRLPANELSMAALQGHFLNDAQSAEESVERTGELLQSVKGGGKRASGSVVDCLFRVGLDRYANLFCFIGYGSAADMSSVSVDNDLLPLSTELKYDPSAQKLLKKVIDSEESFVRAEFTMATLPEIRAAFLAAYPTTHERLTGEKSPFLRRQTSHSKARQMKALVSAGSTEHNLDILPELGGLSRGVSAASAHSSVVEAPAMSADMGAEELDCLSQQFCAALSRGGKGAISLHNLNVLLEIHPNRPRAALDAAKYFVFSEETPRCGVSIQPMTLYEFLKRAGIANTYYRFYPKIKTIQELKDIDDLKKSLCAMSKPYKLSKEEAVCIDEILNQKHSETGNLINFSCHDRGRIMSVFTAFYTNSPKDISAKDKPSAEDDDSNIQAVPTLRVEFDTVSLEKWAYQYAVGATTPRGHALVSVLEVLAHLKKHSDSPEAAVDSVSDELVSPPLPTAPVPEEPPPPPPKEWIETWLESGPGGKELAKYAKHFIEQGIVTEEDLRIGGPVDDGDLKDLMKIEMLGHRRKIVHMMEQLLGKDGNVES